MVLHGIERVVGGAEKFLGRVPILGESRDPRADSERRVLRLGGKSLADSKDDPRRDVLAGFRQDQRELVAAVSRGRVYGAGMVAKNLADTHQGAAAGQMS